MGSRIKTGRGAYAIETAAPVESDADWTVLTLSLERADGIEKVALRFRIARALVESDSGQSPSAERIIERLAPWIEREFEMTRETALKTIRSERRFHVITFDPVNRGPF